MKIEILKRNYNNNFCEDFKILAIMVRTYLIYSKNVIILRQFNIVRQVVKKISSTILNQINEIKKQLLLYRKECFVFQQ